MMDQEFRSLFEDSLNRFGVEKYSHDQWRQYGKDRYGFAPSIWQEMGELGWLGLIQEMDGIGGKIEDLLPLHMAAGQFLWREPIITALGEVVGALETEAGSEAVDTLMQDLAAGRVMPVFAHREEGLGWACGPLSTRAVIEDTEYRLSGEKSYVLAADACSTFVVTAAMGDSQDTALCLVDADAPGISMHSFRTIDDRMAAAVKFDSVPARLLVQGETAIRNAANRAIVVAAAESVGIMKAVNRMTQDYLQSRKQFGKPLSKFQVLQHRLVDMNILQVETGALLQKTARAYGAGSPELTRFLFALRAKSATALKQVTQEAIQMHGGMGVTAELPIGDYYKRALMLEGLCGNSDWAIQQLAQNNSTSRDYEPGAGYEH